MENFPPNSQRARVKPEVPKKIEPVTSGAAVRRKRGLGRQFRDTFIAGDARTAGQYMLMEVIIPELRDLFFDALHGGFNKWVYGDSRKGRPSRGMPSGYSNLGHVDYRSQSMGRQPSRAAEPRMLSRGARARHDFGEIMIPSMREAEEVLSQMFDILNGYNSVSVSDLYELTGIASTHVDKKWGWTDLRGARSQRASNGSYVLRLPEPQPLD